MKKMSLVLTLTLFFGMNAFADLRVGDTVQYIWTRVQKGIKHRYVRTIKVKKISNNTGNFATITADVTRFDVDTSVKEVWRDEKIQLHSGELQFPLYDDNLIKKKFEGCKIPLKYTVQAGTFNTCSVGSVSAGTVLIADVPLGLVYLKWTARAPIVSPDSDEIELVSIKRAKGAKNVR